MLTLVDCIPGRLVECIDANGSPELTERAVYTIAEAAFGFDERDCTTWGVALLDVAAPAGYRGFDPRRFRVVPEGRLSVFRAMLKEATNVEA